MRHRIRAIAWLLAAYVLGINGFGAYSLYSTYWLTSIGAFTNLEEARLEVAYYLDTYFNLDRRHSALGYRSPHQFERDLQISIS
jgi:putative transposase